MYFIRRGEIGGDSCDGREMSSAYHCLLNRAVLQISHVGRLIIRGTAEHFEANQLQTAWSPMVSSGDVALLQTKI